MDGGKREPHDHAAKVDLSPAAAREAAVIVVERLQRAGHTAYFAGGCVRDRLLALEVTDYDIATSALPAQVDAIFASAHFVGEAFGVMLVRCRGFSIQVATFRTDGEYRDHRHPDHVEYTDAQHDALRRDFTINGLFEDPIHDKVIDFVGGVDDLNARVIRAIGDAHDRMAEDHLRMLRAIRFAARFGFAIEEETADTIRREAKHLEGVSRERIGIEVRKMMAHPNRGVAAWELQYLGLDEAVLNEPHRVTAPTRVGRLPEDASATTALTAWLLDRNLGSSTGTLSIRRREALDDAARRWGSVLVLSNQELHDLRETVALYGVLLSDWPRLGVARQKRLAVKPGFRDAQVVLQTIDRPTFVEVRRRVQHLAETGLAPEPYITGDDLIRAGYRPGPTFAYLLDAIYDAQLEGAVHSAEEGLQLARHLEPDGKTAGGTGGGG